MAHAMRTKSLTYSAYATPYTEEVLVKLLSDGHAICRLYLWVTLDYPETITIENFPELLDGLDPEIGGHVTVIVGCEWKAEDEEFVFTVFSPNPSGVSEQIMDYVELTASSIQSSAIQDENYIYFWGSSVVVDTSYDQYVVHRY